MLNKLLATHIKASRLKWGNSNWWPSKDRDFTSNKYPSRENCTTHCGTSELHDIHITKATYRTIANLIAYSVVSLDEGNIIYYAPNSPEYKSAVEKLLKLGFTKLYEGIHLGYLDREPDKGSFSVYRLQITPEEAEKIKEFKKCRSRKARARSAGRRTRSATSRRTGRSTASPVAITNMANGV